MTNEHEKVLVATEVAAPLQNCFDVCLDVESYPMWVDGISEVTIMETDDDGNPKIVKFEAESFGRNSVYVLEYDLSDRPNQLSWTLKEGDVAREIEGAYVFNEESSVSTIVNYELTIDLAVKLPAFLKRRAEEKILTSALNRFRQRVELLNKA